jgi:apolipoprotein N-acyltransferase
MRRRSQEFLLALFLLLVCFAVLVQDSVNRSQFTVPFARVAFVQPDIPATVKWDPAKAPEIMRTLWSTTLAAAASNPDLILWPESTTPFPLNDGDPSMKAFVEQLSARAKAPMLIGADAVEHRSDPRRVAAYNAAFVVDPQVGVQTAYYAKRRLVQFGEYIPLRPLFGWIGKFAPLGDDFSRGDQPDAPRRAPEEGRRGLGRAHLLRGPFPRARPRGGALGADALVVVTNDAWYGEGAAAYQHAAHSVLIAVETAGPSSGAATPAGADGSTSSGQHPEGSEDDGGRVYLPRRVDRGRDPRPALGGAQQLLRRARGLVRACLRRASPSWPPLLLGTLGAPPAEDGGMKK